MLHPLEAFKGRFEGLSHRCSIVEELKPLDGIVSALEDGFETRDLSDLFDKILFSLVLLSQVIALWFDEYRHDRGLPVVGAAHEQHEVRLKGSSLPEVTAMEQLLVPHQAGAPWQR